MKNKKRRRKEEKKHKKKKDANNLIMGCSGFLGLCTNKIYWNLVYFKTVHAKAISIHTNYYFIIHVFVNHLKK